VTTYAEVESLYQQRLQENPDLAERLSRIGVKLRRIREEPTTEEDDVELLRQLHIVLNNIALIRAFMEADRTGTGRAPGFVVHTENEKTPKN